MSNSIINVEKLGKYYSLRQASGERYAVFREVISDKFKKIFGRGQTNHTAQTKTFWALDDVSFAVGEGDVVGIIGRNGAGKSTLLKILSRITEPTRGRAVLRGRLASLLEVGTGFHPELTGRENVFLNGAILGMTRGEVRAKFEEIVQFAEVEKFLDTPVKRYSSGMYVRLAFAVAAHLEPEILVVDEVLAVGDLDFQRKCLGKMRDVASEGRTVLFVSHQLSAIKRLCNRAIVLDKGRLKYDGPVDKAIAIYSMPENATNAREYESHEFVKSVSINQVGDRLIATLSYNDITETIKYPGFGFVIYDSNGHPVLGHNPMLENQVSPGQWLSAGTISATVLNPKLLDGTYFLSVWFGDEFCTIFHEHYCLSFEVLGMVSAKQLDSTSVGSVYPECNYHYRAFD